MHYIKRIIISILLICTFTTTDANPDASKTKSQIINFSILGTSPYVGFSFEHFIQSNKSIEIGGGFIGGGCGLNFYQKKNNKIYQRFYTIKSSYLMQGSGGQRIINYCGTGIKIKINKIHISTDLGPSHTIQITPNGSMPPFSNYHYQKHKISLYGSIKIGLQIKTEQ